MRWEGERYVRLYTRDTINWKLLPWQSKCVIPLVMRKLDRAGMVDLGDAGIAGLAALIDMPMEVVSPGVDGAVRGKAFVIANGALVMPHFIEAQETQVTEAQRQRELRERRRAHGLVRDQTGGTDKWVTVGNGSIQVTEGHEVTQKVTPAVPAVPAEPAEPSQPPPLLPAAVVAFAPDPEETERQLRPDENGEYRPTGLGFCGWWNAARKQKGMTSEKFNIAETAQWADRCIAEVGEERFWVAADTFLSDDFWRKKGCPLPMFKGDNVWRTRANEPPPRKVRL